MLKEKRKRQHAPKPLTPEERAAKNQLRRMKDRAAILSIQKIGEGVYQVWGGSKPHIVQPTINGLITCDCEGWYHARNYNCSHVMKYRLTFGDLKK